MKHNAARKARTRSSGGVLMNRSSVYASVYARVYARVYAWCRAT